MIYWLTQYWGFCLETGQIWSEIGWILIRNRSDLDLIRSGHFWSELTSSNQFQSESDQTTWPKTWNLAGKLSDLILSGFWSDLIRSPGLLQRPRFESYEDSWDPIDLPEPMHGETQPERSVIALPSTLPMRSEHRLPLAWLLRQEFELHKGHANDSLASICQTIGQEAFQYKKILWPAPNKVHHTWARMSIQAVHWGLVLQSQIYIQTRKAMINIDLKPTMVSFIYQMLIKKDIQVSSAIANPNVAGSTGLQLSWI